MRLLRSCVVVVLVGLTACGSKAKPSPSNVPPTEEAAKPAKPEPAFKAELVDRAAGGHALEGTVRDAATKEALAGATLVVTSPALQGERTAISDDGGRFVFDELPEGKYVLTLYYLEMTVESSVEVKQGKMTKVVLALDIPRTTGEVVRIETDPPKPKVYKDATEALTDGAVEQAYTLGSKDLAKSPSAKLHGMLALAKYGMAVEAFHTELFRAARDPKVKELRASIAKLVTDLDTVQMHLTEAAKDPQFVLELCVACMTAEGALGLPPGFLDIERDRAGKELPEGDARRRPTFRFDHGDLAWGRAMVSFQQALANVSLAYDWNWFETILLSGQEPADGSKITIKVVEPARIAKARELVLAGLKFSDESRAAYLKETDDDREWVPNPKQKSYASPLAVDAKLYKTWEDVVGDVRALVDSKAGISLPAMWKLFGGKRGGPTGFLDVGAMFTSPKDIVIEVGAIDRIEVEKNPKNATKLMNDLIKGLVGDGYKANMKASRITDRLLQLRKDLDKEGGDDVVADKLKYLIWIN